MQTVTVRRGYFPPFIIIAFLILSLGLIIYYQVKTVKLATASLTEQMAKTIGIDAPEAIFHEAIQLAAKNLAEELGINLENYDITQEEYEALIAAAVEKFGFCEQYRLCPRISGYFVCYSCNTKPKILLQVRQTYKIGQTCFEEKGRYVSGLPHPYLVYKPEFKGSIFEVLVAENVKLLLFRYSLERKIIMKTNNLLDTELLLPPANKILR